MKYIRLQVCRNIVQCITTGTTISACRSTMDIFIYDIISIALPKYFHDCSGSLLSKNSLQPCSKTSRDGRVLPRVVVALLSCSSSLLPPSLSSEASFLTRLDILPNLRNINSYSIVKGGAPPRSLILLQSSRSHSTSRNLHPPPTFHLLSSFKIF
jgi:hypothetical protein